ncbi:MAG: GNAT family N-acetyltransferase [Oscillospiraceae bacterium]|nr:GNAT family N-acetyltransferase [Oscillospiraceae bacterium]
MKLTLETERLRLRPFRLDDAEAMFSRWASDDEVTKYLTWTTHTDLAQTKEILARWVAEYEQPERLNFAIELKEEGDKLIGGIDVVHYDEGMPVIGYNLSRAYWGRGYMTEACRRVLDYLFSRGFEAVKIDAIVENAGSNRVIRKCGGELIATEEDYLPRKDRTVRVNRYIVKKKA